jgi:endonuclease/exonuclease/phosphatase (EEP) superfamily protein YafD
LFKGLRLVSLLKEVFMRGLMAHLTKSCRPGKTNAGAWLALAFLFLFTPQWCQAFTVLTMNCGNGANVEFKALPVIAKVVRERRPDVLLLQEGEPYGQKIQEQFGFKNYIRHHYPCGLYNFSLILTSYPVLETGVLLLGDAPSGNGVAVYSVLQIEGKRVLVVSVHLKALGLAKRTSDQVVPFQFNVLVGALYQEVFGDSVRSRSVGRLLAFIRGRADVDDCIVAGDFNTLPFSTAIRKMNCLFSDVLAWELDYLGGTFHKIDFPIKPRVDYIFYRGKLKPTWAHILKDSPGDHYPVMAKFEFSS